MSGVSHRLPAETHWTSERSPAGSIRGAGLEARHSRTGTNAPLLTEQEEHYHRRARTAYSQFRTSYGYRHLFSPPTEEP